MYRLMLETEGATGAGGIVAGTDHAAAGHPATGDEELGVRLWYLESWPTFSAEQDLRQVGAIARICALLSRKPTVGFLVPMGVRMSADAVMPQLAELVRSGHVRPFQNALAAEEPAAAAQQQSMIDASVQESRESREEPDESAESGFVGRLWKKLLERVRN